MASNQQKLFKDMGRTKARLMEVITDKKVRGVTFEKRRKGLEKKAYELSTLCGVKVCFIIFDNDNNPNEPKIWPENPEEIHSLIDSYKNSSAEDRRIRTTDFTFFHKDRMRRAEGDLDKLRAKNLQAKLQTWDERYDNLSLEGLRNFDDLLKAKVEALRARVDFLKGTQNYFAETSGVNLLTSLYDAKLQPQIMMNSSMIDHQNNQNLCRRRSNNMQLEFLQNHDHDHQLPMSNSFGPRVHGLDVPQPLQDSWNLNPNMTNLMNNGASSSNNPAIIYDDETKKPIYTAAEHVISSLSSHNNAGGGGRSPLYCYFPTMQPLPVSWQYPMQHNSRVSSEMLPCNSTQNWINYEQLEYWQLQNSKKLEDIHNHLLHHGDGEEIVWQDDVWGLQQYTQIPESHAKDIGKDKRN